MSITIVMQPGEVAVALRAVADRMADSLVRNRDHARTIKRTLPQRLEQELAGALVEVAVQRLLGAPAVLTLDGFKNVPDCARGVEARGTTYASGKLIIRDDDPPERPYVLGIVVFPPDSSARVRLVGWVFGKEAAEYGVAVGSGRPAFFVSQALLRPVESLPGARL